MQHNMDGKKHYKMTNEYCLEELKKAGKEKKKIYLARYACIIFKFLAEGW